MKDEIKKFFDEWIKTKRVKQKMLFVWCEHCKSMRGGIYVGSFGRELIFMCSVCRNDVRYVPKNRNP